MENLHTLFYYWAIMLQCFCSSSSDICQWWAAEAACCCCQKCSTFEKKAHSIWSTFRLHIFEVVEEIRRSQSNQYKHKHNAMFFQMFIKLIHWAIWPPLIWARMSIYDQMSIKPSRAARHQAVDAALNRTHRVLFVWIRLETPTAGFCQMLRKLSESPGHWESNLSPIIHVQCLYFSGFCFSFVLAVIFIATSFTNPREEWGVARDLMWHFLGGEDKTTKDHLKVTASTIFKCFSLVITVGPNYFMGKTIIFIKCFTDPNYRITINCSW